MNFIIIYGLDHQVAHQLWIIIKLKSLKKSHQF